MEIDDTKVELESTVAMEHVEPQAHLEASSIKAINKQSVHRICSGQVVLSLATAVKELVENSLDAGANNIEVRLREYGSELIEVIDNGEGVKRENFEGLTLKHHTSKLKDFADLPGVETFGFRGEALSSLCALSKVTITTRYKDSTVGSKLDYDHNGKLLSITPCARQTGTTVSLQNLFSTVHVRHRLFLRNLKKEFHKMVQILSAYCIISTQVKITCTNIVGKGKKTLIVNTNGNETMKENITNVYGSKQMQSLVGFVQHMPGDDECNEYNIHQQTAGCDVRITGYISSCVHGQGRSSTDRQFYYINKRPCDIVKVSRVVNEVYHIYNRHQYPFVVLAISLDKESVDVNVTPDKRQAFVEDEKLILAILKTSLVKLLDPQASLYRINQVLPGKTSGYTSSPKLKLDTTLSSPAVLGRNDDGPSTKEKLTTPTLSNLKRSFSSAFSRESPIGITAKDRSAASESKSKQRKLDSFLTKTENDIEEINYSDITTSTMLSNSGPEEDRQADINSEGQVPVNYELETPPLSVELVTNINLETVTYGAESKVIDCDDSSISDSEVNDTVCQGHRSGHVIQYDVDHTCESHDTKTGANISSREDVQTGSNEHQNRCVIPFNEDKNSKSIPSGKSSDFTSILSREPHLDEGNTRLEKSLHENEKNVALISTLETHRSTNAELKITLTEIDEFDETIKKREITVPFSMDKLRQRMKKHDSLKKSKALAMCRKFRAKITPGENNNAEEELSKQISKDMFTNMEILGQFNLGFIIAKFERDLFIIDQHATDEKYNFEMLQRHTVIQNQKLIQPQSLELTAANEAILMDNLEVFHKNGFDFIIDEDGQSTERVRLVSMPVSKNWTFGKEDIEELVFMLSDSPGVMCRPSRVRMMFASRSCRKSIMIGTALNKAEMGKLVYHMSELDQPWNCPHGRPTMRHLINLDMLPE